MAHEHVPLEHADNETRLGRAFFLILSFTAIEAIGGYFSNSLTLLADAGHMFLDSSALGLSWYAMRLARREHTRTHSYGYHRFQVLAAFINGLTLLALCAWIVIEAISRIETPTQILPIPALTVAITGLVVNVVAFRMLHGSQNLNVRSAALHVLGDLLGSCAAIAAALGVLVFGWMWLDPVLALLIAAILLRGAWRICRESVHILLEGVPHDIDLEEIRNTLTAQVAGVMEIHHVHAWALTSERPMVTLHATVEDSTDEHDAVTDIKTVLMKSFGIGHSTIQVERGPCPDDDHGAHPDEPTGQVDSAP